jgi:hypothetical protein
MKVVMQRTQPTANKLQFNQEQVQQKMDDVSEERMQFATERTKRHG